MAEVSHRIEIPQTGEAASEDNPSCYHGGTNSGEVILKAGAAAIDAYIGQPFVSGALEQVAPGNRQWLKDRLGISNGKSNCVTICLVVPRNSNPTFTISFSETGGDGYSEKSSQNVADLNGSYGTGWCGVENASVRDTENATVLCVTGKNWSHNRNRWFQARANY